MVQHDCEKWAFDTRIVKCELTVAVYCGRTGPAPNLSKEIYITESAVIMFLGN